MLFIIKRLLTNEKKLMNKKQFNLCAKKRIRCSQEIKAMELVLFEDKTAYQAEKNIHGQTTNTVNRNIKKVKAEFSYCIKVSEAK
jgi:hypothetical protein